MRHGAHTRMLITQGACVTACDLTRRATHLTRARLAIDRLPVAITRGDAVELPFEASSFDFVWSWGVIHHSRDPERCVAEIARVLRPGGEARVMVYNRDSIGYWVDIMLVKGLLLGRFTHTTAAKLANDHSDGSRTTFWTRREVRKVFDRFFAHVDVHVFGQRSEMLPLPARIRHAILPAIPPWLAQPVLKRVGAFLFVIAKRN